MMLRVKGDVNRRRKRASDFYIQAQKPFMVWLSLVLCEKAHILHTFCGSYLLAPNLWITKYVGTCFKTANETGEPNL